MRPAHHCRQAETNRDNWRPLGNTADQEELVETKSDHWISPEITGDQQRQIKMSKDHGRAPGKKLRPPDTGKNL